MQISRPISAMERDLLDSAVVDFILQSMTPYSQVDKAPLGALLSKFRPGYKVISSRTLCRRLVELYAIILSDLSKFISELPV